jgi:hypothetical protein
MLAAIGRLGNSYSISPAPPSVPDEGPLLKKQCPDRERRVLAVRYDAPGTGLPVPNLYRPKSTDIQMHISKRC